VAVSVYKFGDFRLDCDRFELYRVGRSLKLERKPMELLVLLATRNGNLVTRSEIAEHLWGREVFVDTEHGINTAIRKIREVLGDDPVQSRFIQTVTGKGYRFIGSIVEVPDETVASTSQHSDQTSTTRNRRVGDINPPPSSTGAVAIQDPPSGNEAPPPEVSISPNQDEPPPPRNSRLRIWLLALTGLALLILAVTLGTRVLRNRLHPAAPKITSLAVLPLDNLSGDPAQNYFADGMTDELTTCSPKTRPFA
jgi:DNA-binding winged helix-turn-helix (wHTH) protein